MNGQSTMRARVHISFLVFVYFCIFCAVKWQNRSIADNKNVETKIVKLSSRASTESIIHVFLRFKTYGRPGNSSLGIGWSDNRNRSNFS